MTLWIQTLEGRSLSNDSDDHSLMYDTADQLDALAKRLGVRPLSTFFDTTDLELNMGDAAFDVDGTDPDTGAAYRIEDMRWFEAADGLATLRALRQQIAAEGLDGLQEDDRAALLDELDDCIAVLDRTAGRDGRFNLPVIM